MTDLEPGGPTCRARCPLCDFDISWTAVASPERLADDAYRQKASAHVEEHVRRKLAAHLHQTHPRPAVV